MKQDDGEVPSRSQWLKHGLSGNERSLSHHTSRIWLASRHQRVPLRVLSSSKVHVAQNIVLLEIGACFEQDKHAA